MPTRKFDEALDIGLINKANQFPQKTCDKSEPENQDYSANRRYDVDELKSFFHCCFSNASFSSYGTKEQA